jgi:ABC-2 type transport system ATP-binding protein
MLEIQGLAKTYRGRVLALDGLNLSVPAGMFGLLGPNGAGKSTLMRILAGLQLPDRGSVNFAGTDVLADPLALRQQLGYLPQSFGAYPYISCRALLRHMAVLKGLPETRQTDAEVDRLLELTNLAPYAKRSVAAFSGGMRQRFGIAQALLGDPRLLILDEPTAGLDPEERLRLYNLLGDLSAERVVLLSTHIVDDAEQLCPEVAVIVGGKIRVRGATAALVEVLDGQVWQSMGSVEPSGKAMLLNTAYSRGNRVRRYHCAQRPGPDFEAVRPTLEDRYFLELRRAEVAVC